jgi:molybdate transport system regulatory protein
MGDPSSMRAQRLRGRRHWDVRTKVWLEGKDGYVFGYGVARILEQVEKSGALTAAARALGRSYRYVWRRVRDCERSLGRRLVYSRVGGHGASRSRLSPYANRLLQDYLDLRHAVQQYARRRF